MGTFKSREGTVHKGEWYNDIRHGPGHMRYASGNEIKGTWESDRLNGEGEIINKGKPAKKVVFKMDLAIETYGQGEFKTMVYIVSSVVLMLSIYILATLATLVLDNGEDFYSICIVLYIIYVIMSCCTDSQKFANNITNYDETISNVHKAIAAAPILRHHI